MRVTILGTGHLATVVSETFIGVGHTLSDPGTAMCVVLAYDTPIFNGKADTAWVIDQFDRAATKLFSNTLIVVMSQLPVGTVRQLESLYPQFRFASCPENVRANSTYHDFLNQPIICGVRHLHDSQALSQLFHYTTPTFMSVESAEMVKHAINAYLALCISFINEIGDVCKAVGANINEVECGLKLDSRVSPSAPLTAGEPFGLGHLDRDLNYLLDAHETDLIRAIQFSNENRRAKVKV